MSDEIEQQLAAFGRTLAAETREQLAPETARGSVASRRRERRWWALGGAAACVVAVVVGLGLLDRPGDVEPAATLPAAATTTSIPTTTGPLLLPTETTSFGPFDPTGSTPVDDLDPLALESVGWTVSVPDTSPFEYDAGALPVECPVAQRIEGFNGTSRAAYEAELGTIRMDLSILDLGSPERASEFAEAFLLLEPCLVEAVDGAAAVTSLSSIRASWVRVGLDLAVGTVVDDDGDVVLFAVERGPFSDDLIADIAHRADQHLRGDEVVGSWPAGAVPFVLNVHCGIGWLGHDGETWTIDGGPYRPVPPEWAALMDRTVRPDDLPLVLVDDGDVLRLTGGGLTIELVPTATPAPGCD